MGLLHRNHDDDDVKSKERREKEKESWGLRKWMLRCATTAAGAAVALCE